jgi:hypothetical protein
MATFNPFLDFTEQLARGVHQIGTHTYKVALTNTAPINTQTGWSLANHPAPVAANGYPAGGASVTVTISETAGLTTVQGQEVTFTATAGGIGPFRYAVLYNDTATSPADAAVAFWDYGASITLGEAEAIKLRFNNQSPGTILTVAFAA